MMGKVGGVRRVSLALGCVATLLVPAPRAFKPGDPPTNIERSYRVFGRVRLLVIWTDRRDVGQASIGWSAAPDGGRRLKLLVGTDPDRAPRRLNRWGYLTETAGSQSADVLGVMTASDEETIEDATASLDTAAERGHVFKAVRASQTGAETHTEVLRLRVDENFTYKDLPALLGRLPAPGVRRQGFVPADTDSGFLAAVANLLRDSMSAYRGTRRIQTPMHRRYVYAGRVYSMTLRKARPIDSWTYKSRLYPSVVEGEFTVTNLTSRATTNFQITYGAVGAQSEVPIRIVYRPRWWLELELSLE